MAESSNPVPVKVLLDQEIVELAILELLHQMKIQMS